MESNAPLILLVFALFMVLIVGFVKAYLSGGEIPSNPNPSEPPPKDRDEEGKIESPDFKRES